jgi:hypothetical protein
VKGIEPSSPVWKTGALPLSYTRGAGEGYPSAPDGPTGPLASRATDVDDQARGGTVSIIEQRLRIVPQFRPDEYPQVTNILAGKLDRRLSRFGADKVELELSVKDRDTDSQRVVLECWITGQPRFVATSTERSIEAGVAEVRDDLFRQVDRHVTRKETNRRR